MTDKQKETIEKCKSRIDNNKKHIGNKEKLRRSNQKIVYLKRELQKKDKMIDLMSEQLTTPLHSKEWVKEYFERKVENGN